METPRKRSRGCGLYVIWQCTGAMRILSGHCQASWLSASGKKRRRRGRTLPDAVLVPAAGRSSYRLVVLHGSHQGGSPSAFPALAARGLRRVFAEPPMPNLCEKLTLVRARCGSDQRQREAHSDRGRVRSLLLMRTPPPPVLRSRERRSGCQVACRDRARSSPPLPVTYAVPAATKGLPCRASSHITSVRRISFRMCVPPVRKPAAMARIDNARSGERRGDERAGGPLPPQLGPESASSAMNWRGCQSPR